MKCAYRGLAFLKNNRAQSAQAGYSAGGGDGQTTASTSATVVAACSCCHSASLVSISSCLRSSWGMDLGAPEGDKSAMVTIDDLGAVTARHEHMTPVQDSPDAATGGALVVMSPLQIAMARIEGRGAERLE